MKKEDREEAEEYVKWLSELSKDDIPAAGGKGANLAEMFNNKLPVPPAFIVTAQAFEKFISKIKNEIAEIIKKTDIEDTKQLNESSKKIREIIEKQDIPENMEKEILESYEHLGAEEKDFKGASGDALSILKVAKEPVFVAVRSSATTEDLASASFAGQQESFLAVKGNSQLIASIKKCFSSLYTPRAIYYREKRGFGHEKALLAVIVQRMINSEKSGVIFTKNPIQQDNNIVIEAVFGLGEGIVSGKINPDNYTISRELEILDKKTADKKKALVRTGSGAIEEVKLTEQKSASQVLTDSEIKRLADYGLELEKHYKKPQDIEFAIENREIYIVQTRPITTSAKSKGREIEGKVLLQGLAASPGIGTGKVKIVRSLNDLEKIKKGDILVTEMTNPDMVVTMQKCDAIVTDEGGSTSHASIVSREMGIPAVVGTKQATKLLQDGQIVTVDGGAGKVYEGKVGEEKKEEVLPVVKTRTKIKVILDLPDYAQRAAKTGCKQVGLLRLEGIIAESGKHPLMFLAENRMEAYTEIIRKGVEKIAEHFDSIWVRTSDIRSDEFRNLSGSPKEQETNPMLGFHGIRFSLKNPAILEAEIFAVKKVAEKFPDKELGVMFPQVISVGELKKAKKILEKFRKSNMKTGIMVETPAACELIGELCEEGIDFISLGTNDLTQYTLAVDRGNENVQDIYNEMHPAVLKQIEKVIKICREKKAETSICGQAASKKEMVKFLVEKEIDSISVNADAAYEISVLIHELEKKKESKGNKEILDKDREEKIIEEHKQKEETEEKGEEEKDAGAEEETTDEFPDTDIGIDIFNPGSSLLEKETSEKDENEETSEKEEPEEEIMEKHDEFPELGIGFDFFQPVKVIGKEMEERPVLGSVIQESSFLEKETSERKEDEAGEKTEEEEQEEDKEEKKGNNKNKENKKGKGDLDEGEDIKEIIDELHGKKDEDDIDIEEKDENVLDIF